VNTALRMDLRGRFLKVKDVCTTSAKSYCRYNRCTLFYCKEIHCILFIIEIHYDPLS
jgi:hypothetical protein